MKGRSSACGKEKSGVVAALRTIFKKWDILLIAVLLVAAALSVAFALRGGGDEARVYVDGVLRYTFALDTDGVYDILDGRMTLEVRDGKVSVTRSDCEGQECVHSAPQSAEGGMIVCLPNHVIIQVGEREVDAVT